MSAVTVSGTSIIVLRTRHLPGPSAPAVPGAVRPPLLGGIVPRLRRNVTFSVRRGSRSSPAGSRFSLAGQPLQPGPAGGPARGSSDIQAADGPYSGPFSGFL